MVKIIQISAVSRNEHLRDIIYGLSDDGRIYRWKWGKDKQDWTLDTGTAW